MSKDAKPSEIDLRPDGEERFRQAVHAAAKSGKKPRAKEPPEKKYDGYTAEQWENDAGKRPAPPLTDEDAEWMDELVESLKRPSKKSVVKRKS